MDPFSKQRHLAGDNQNHAASESDGTTRQQLALHDLLGTHEYFRQLVTFFNGGLLQRNSSLEKLLLNSNAILDVGCGDGVLVAPLQRCGLNVYGVELSEMFVAAAKAQSPQPEKIVMADVSTLTSKDPRLGGQTFDLIISRTLFASACDVIFNAGIGGFSKLPSIDGIQKNMISGIANSMSEGATWLLYDNRSLQLIPNQAFLDLGLKIVHDNKRSGVMILTS